MTPNKGNNPPLSPLKLRGDGGVTDYKLINPDFRSELAKIAAQYERKQAALLPTLHYLQEKLGWISLELEAEIARLLETPEIKVREVVSFYHMFHTKAVGKHQIKLCQTLSCHLNGCDSVLSHLEKKLGIKPGETTKDGKFTLETAECLGACEIAPMMQVNAKPYGPLTSKKIDEILDNLK